MASLIEKAELLTSAQVDYYGHSEIEANLHVQKVIANAVSDWLIKKQTVDWNDVCNFFTYALIKLLSFDEDGKLHSMLASEKLKDTSLIKVLTECLVNLRFNNQTSVNFPDNYFEDLLLDRALPKVWDVCDGFFNPSNGTVRPVDSDDIPF